MKTPRFKRILLKLSGEVLRDPDTGECISDRILAEMAAQIKASANWAFKLAWSLEAAIYFAG